MDDLCPDLMKKIILLYIRYLPGIAVMAAGRWLMAAAGNIRRPLS